MEEFRKRQAVFLLQLLGVTLVIYGVHAYLLSHFATEVFFFLPSMAHLSVSCFNHHPPVLCHKLSVFQWEEGYL
jgi:hypothetical protein